ncbi:hypothetical protein NYR55_07075 [Sphingomonas sp. BGYR3]|uniref:hypothetical protein n=1 Tax=Sphingomonas sp. BGYR3 TaxID=2975483 RepID=UPI0021A5A644|nr:hypothetical protein [Sphingomonas sp. BGYR3]MDG5488381.1 hypothetical protein [Sphingomonas sp. BGYR3]
MIRWPILPLFPLLIAARAHSGEVVRDGFELADAVMFGVVAVGILIARRALRSRFARRKD